MTAAGQAPVLVTGGSGFIGGALVDALTAAARPVRALAISARAALALRDRVRSRSPETCEMPTAWSAPSRAARSRTMLRA